MAARDEDDDTSPDYFDGEDIEEPEKPKKIVYSDDDPRYWTETADTWDHLRMGRKQKALWWWVGGAVVLIFALTFLWIWLFRPYSEGATQAGYVDRIEYEGSVFKSFEGVLLPYKELMDTTRVYRSDFDFSLKDSKMAATMKRLMLRRKPVRVEYKRYHVALPWRGASKNIVVKVDSVDPSLLLPPDVNPAK